MGVKVGRSYRGKNVELSVNVELADVVCLQDWIQLL